MPDQPEGFFHQIVQVFWLYIQLARRRKVKQPTRDGIGPIDGIAHFLQHHCDVFILCLAQFPVQVVDPIIMMANGFFTSCATPAASVPMDSIFSAWISCNCADLSSSCERRSAASLR